MKKIKWAFGFAKGKCFLLIVGLLLISVNTGFELFQTVLQKNILDNIVDNSLIKEILIQIIILAAAYCATSALFLVNGCIFHNICYCWREQAMRYLTKRIQKLPISDFDNERISKLTALYSEVEGLGEEFFYLPYKLGNVIKILGLLIILLFIDFRAILILIVCNLALIIYINYIMPKMQEIGRQVFNKRYDMITCFEEGISGTNEIIVNQYQRSYLNKIQKIFMEYIEKIWDETTLSNRTITFSSIIRWGSVILILFLNAKSVMNGTITLGEYYLIYQYSNQFSELAKQVNNDILAIIKLSVKLEKVYGKINSLEEIDFEKGYDLKDKVSDLRFENVDFSYRNNKNILSDFSAQLCIGGKNIILGESGSGKSTLTELLLKNYQIKSGSIMINNKYKLDSISLKSWLGKINIIYQDGYVFQDTIRNNILIGRTGVTDKEILKICDCVKLSEFIETLPNGLDEKIGERGGNISGGQKQRLLIARALVQKKEILIMDEATSALDDCLKEIVEQNIDQLYKGKTLIIITHRSINSNECYNQINIGT